MKKTALTFFSVFVLMECSLQILNVALQLYLNATLLLGYSI